MGKCKYTGEMNAQNGPHGPGKAVSGNGYRYEGTFKDSLVKRKEFYPYGALRYEGKLALRYEGEFSGDRYHGMGSRFGSGGEVSTGRYEEGGFIQGTGTYPDGMVVKVVDGKFV